MYVHKCTEITEILSSQGFYSFLLLISKLADSALDPAMQLDGVP